MNLPQNLSLSLMQTQWASLINPALNNPLNTVSLLNHIALINGYNVINHKLGRMMQGWFLTDISGSSSTIYRVAPFNATTLTLSSSSPTTISLGVF